MYVYIYSAKPYFHVISMYTRRGIAGSYGSSFLKFWWTSKLFTIVVTPTYFPTNSAQRLLFLYIVNNTCYSLFKWYSNKYEALDISLWFWFAFLWWLVMSSKLFMYLLAICLSSLGKWQFSLLILDWISVLFYFVFCYWVLWVIYIFLKSTPICYRHHTSWFKLYYRAILIKTVRHWDKMKIS